MSDDEEKPRRARGFNAPDDGRGALARALLGPPPTGPVTEGVALRRRIAEAVSRRPIGALPEKPKGLFDAPFVPPCPICQHPHWEIRGPANKDPAVFFEATSSGQLWKEADRSVHPQVLPVVAFVCARCGFIRHHAADKYQGVL